MGIARLCFIIIVFGLLTPFATGAESIAPPSSELNGVATITEAVPLELGVTKDVPTVLAALEPEETTGFEGPVAVDLSSPTSNLIETIGEVARPQASDPDGELAASIIAEDVSADVLSQAGATASFDRRAIFGASADASVPTGDGGAISPAGATAWWNAPELRVFGLLSVLVIAAVMMRRFGGRAIGLAGGPRPSGVVSVLGRFPFGRSASLVLLECGPKVLLLHQQAGKGGAVTTLSEFGDRDEVAELRRQLNANERDAKGGFGRDLEQSLGLYDRRGRPKGFSGDDGLPIQGPIETVDLTRRRPRRGVRGN